MEQLTRFQNWCEQNNILIQSEDNNQFLVPKFGKILLIAGKDEYIVDADCCLNLNASEVSIIELQISVRPENAIKYLVFEFGQRFYYNKLVPWKDEWNNIKYQADFNDFKLIGECIDPFIEQPFVHLGVHTEYDLLNGSHASTDWLKKTKFLGQKALAICDLNTLAGTLAHQLACKKADIKSILGMTVSIAHSYDPEVKIQSLYEMKLYVKDFTGWQNLLQINKAINVDYMGFVPEEVLLQHSKGLIAVISKESLFNKISQDVDRCTVFLYNYMAHFDSVYYQIDTVEFYDDNADLNYLSSLKTYLNEYRQYVKPVLINDSYYIEQEMFQLKEWLNQLAGKTSDYSENQHYKTLGESFQQLLPLFPNAEYFDELFNEMVANTVVIADQCNFEIETGKHKLPRYEWSKDQTNEELFFELIEKGIQLKLSNKEDIDRYMERIAIECEVIVGAGFIDYFLILWDIVDWAKTKAKPTISVGTGRGSVGGSLIAYLLDIITVDPVANDLLFERFLNAARISGERAKAADSMPDVDLDFESSRRDEVKAYISQHFGEYHTCSIGSYTRIKLKAGIKDFGRCRGLSFKEANIVSSYIDNQLEYTWQDFIMYAIIKPELTQFMQDNPNVAMCMKYALGQCRSASIHASAVIIVPKKDDAGNDVNIFNWLPIRKIDDRLVSEWEGKYIERAGFLKEDILALKQLDKFKKIQQLIKQNLKKKLVLEKIPMTDEKTFKLFHKGFTEDVFQFTSSGLHSYSVNVKPDNIEDLTAMSALYRPGPMESNAHIDFYKIKQGKKKVRYDYGLQSVTQNTYGLYIYQEQIMKAVVVLGGFSLVEADILRTQIKKFDSVGMAKGAEQFINGAIARGCPPDEAQEIWTKLVAFSGYGFNKSHSFAYSVMSYWSQYLKANYPLEFWTSSLQYADEKDVHRVIGEMARIKQGITVKPPDVNYSDFEFTCNPDTQNIYWSLAKIKNVGNVAVTFIIAERKKNGIFKSYDDFVNRVPKGKVNKRVVGNLIIAGAFDEIESLSKVSERMELIIKHHKRCQEDLPDEFDDVNNKKSFWWIFKQRELTGFGIIDWKSYLTAIDTPKSRKMAALWIDSDTFLDSKDYTKACVCGKVTYAKRRHSKNGDFLVLNIEQNNELILVNIWNDCWQDNMDFVSAIEAREIINIAVTGKIKNDSWRNFNVLHTFDHTQFLQL